MKNFDVFLSQLPTLVKDDQLNVNQLNHALHSFDNGHPLFSEDEMIQIIRNPDIDWMDIKLLTIDNHPCHVIPFLMHHMSIEQSIPVEPRLAEAFSQRLGAERTISLISNSMALPGHHAHSYECRNVLASRFAVICSLIDGGIDALVDQFLSRLKLKNFYMDSELEKHPGCRDAFRNLESGKQGVNLSVCSVMAILAVLTPEPLKHSLGRYVDGLTAWEALHDCSNAFFSPTNASLAMQGMLFVLNRMFDDQAIERFIRFSLPSTPNGDPAFGRLQDSLNATLIINALARHAGGTMIEAIQGSTTPESWQEIADYLLHEEASEWHFGVMAEVYKQGPQSPLFQALAESSQASSFVEVFQERYYVPTKSGSTLFWLTQMGDCQETTLPLFTKGLSRAIPAKGKVNILLANNLFELFAEFEEAAALCQAFFKDHPRNLLKLAFNAIRKQTWGDHWGGIKLLGHGIRLNVIDPAEAFGAIKTVDEYQELLRALKLNAQDVLPLLNKSMRKSLLASDLSL